MNRKSKSAWKDEYYVRIYQMTKDGLDMATIARTIGVLPATLVNWYRTKPALRAAIKDAQKTGKEKEKGYVEFRDFVYGRLPEDAQELWDELESIMQLPEMMDRVKKQKEVLNLITASDKRIRQHLFLYALIHCNFMKTTACRKTGISPETVTLWMKKDAAFRTLIGGVHEAKKDFFEEGLVKLVSGGDVAATIFANKTVNADRGYNPSSKVSVDVNQKVDHIHQIKADDLPPEVLSALLEATRRKQALQLDDRSEVEEAELVGDE